MRTIFETALLSACCVDLAAAIIGYDGTIYVPQRHHQRHHPVHMLNAGNVHHQEHHRVHLRHGHRRGHHGGHGVGHDRGLDGRHGLGHDHDLDHDLGHNRTRHNGTRAEMPADLCREKGQSVEGDLADCKDVIKTRCTKGNAMTAFEAASKYSDAFCHRWLLSLKAATSTTTTPAPVATATVSATSAAAAVEDPESAPAAVEDPDEAFPAVPRGIMPPSPAHPLPSGFSPAPAPAPAATSTSTTTTVPDLIPSLTFTHGPPAALGDWRGEYGPRVTEPDTIAEACMQSPSRWCVTRGYPTPAPTTTPPRSGSVRRWGYLDPLALLVETSAALCVIAALN